MIDELQALLNSVPQQPSLKMSPPETNWWAFGAFVAAVALCFLTYIFLVHASQVAKNPTVPTPKHRRAAYIACAAVCILAIFPTFSALSSLAPPQPERPEDAVSESYIKTVDERDQHMENLLVQEIRAAQPNAMIIKLIVVRADALGTNDTVLPIAAGPRTWVVTPKYGDRYYFQTDHDTLVMRAWTKDLLDDERPRVEVTYTTGIRAVFEASRTGSGELALVPRQP
ncbi:hypothetical protein ANMWB30_24000 [Arthrobacter sp. MWB30]|nr:hypothetical protein ANMWB30_24000 [Arthrobacter sp. MWB30]